MRFRGVLFDLGGVVLGSPFSAIVSFERAHGISEGFINRHIFTSGPHGAWHKLERGELDTNGFAPLFEAECAASSVTVDARALIHAITGATAPRPRFLRAIEVIRAKGLVAAALTNNWLNDATHLLASRFDVFLESSKLGLRKPDPKIYQLACERMGLGCAEIVYLDDIGQNLKPARALGITTIKVDEPELALAELENKLGFALA